MRPPAERVGLGLAAPLGAERVKALGSSMEVRSREPARLREGGAAGGGGGGGEEAAGGGGGGAGGALLGEGEGGRLAARMAAWAARFGGPADGGGGGGGGAGEDVAGEGGGRGAAEGGGGGGAGGAGAADGGGGGGAGAAEGGGGGAGVPGMEGGWLSMEEDGLREAGRGGGFLPMGGGGPFLPMGGGRSDGLPGMLGAAAPGGLGALMVGGLGAEKDLPLDSGSERYEEESEAPVSTPPRLFRSFGMPPAKSPPSCGAASMPAPELSRPLWSLLLLARFPGAGGASPPGGLGMPPIPIPGTGGAPPIGGPAELFADLPTIGAERSFVTAFRSALPLPISPRRAPWENKSVIVPGFHDRG